GCGFFCRGLFVLGHGEFWESASRAQRLGAARTNFAVRAGLERGHPAPAARTPRETQFAARSDRHVKPSLLGRAQRDMRDDEKFGKKIAVLFQPAQRRLARAAAERDRRVERLPELARRAQRLD